jgi:hypothetical protein
MSTGPCPPRSCSRAWAVALLVVVVGACATPARRLPSREVDDPITLPARVFELGVGAMVTPSDEYGATDGEPLIPVRYGITDRVTLLGLLAVEVALLDDAPVASAATGERAATSPLGLSLTGGLVGLGYSSIEGMIVQPVFGVRAVKHVSRSLRLQSNVYWIGRFGRLHDEAVLAASVGATLQLVDRLALTLDAGDRVNVDTFLPSGDWERNVVFAGPSLEYRPWHWVTGGLGARVEATRRPRATFEPVAPDDPRPGMPRRQPVSIWLGAWLNFYW